MVRTHLQAITVSQINIPLIFGIDTVTTLSGFQIDICHLGILAYGLPEHLTLIMTHIQSMHMFAGILTTDIGILMNGGFGDHPCHLSAPAGLFLLSGSCIYISYCHAAKT